MFWITNDITCKEKGGVKRRLRMSLNVKENDLRHWTVSAAVLIRGLVLVENSMREQFLCVPNQVSSSWRDWG